MKNQLRFDGPRLEDLLERVQSELGPDVTIVDATRTRKGGVAGFFAKEWYQIVVEHDAVETGEGGDRYEDPFLALADAIDDRREPAPDLAAGELADAGGADDLGAADAARPVLARARAAHATEPSFAVALAAAHRERAVGGISPTEAPAPAGRSALVTASRPDVAPATAAAVTPSAPRAVDARVPAPRTRRLRDLELSTLLAHLDTLVPAVVLPATDAPVIAVVGDLASAGAAATRLAVGLGLDGSDVVVARPEPVAGTPPWLEISDPQRAASRAERWRTSGHATVVVVELAPGREGHAWAASMLASIAPDQIRLVAKAWQMSDQLAAKATALGGVDGLELVEVDAAAEPELFLELGLPVLAIDGRPATGELWAALLYERRIDERHDV